MPHWTRTARELLDKHLQSRRKSLAASGADPDEVVADLRRHVEEELATRQLATVTADDVRGVLQRMGEWDVAAMEAPADAPPNIPVGDSASSAKPRAGRPPRYPFFFFFGIVLPALTLLLEGLTHMCGGVFFDPIPTVWHGVLVGCVPVVNFFLWQLARHPSAAYPWWRIAGGGFAAVLSGAYALLFVPLILPAIIAIVIYGWGLLPLSPLLSLLASGRLLWLIIRRQAPDTGRAGTWLAGGAMTGLAALSLVNAPQWLTHHWVSRVAQAETAGQARGALNNLRTFGHEETLLRACYRSVAGFGGYHGWGWELGARMPDIDASRRIYFQVTGRPFNAVPPPQRKYGSARWGFLDDWEWDQGHGGTAVAGRIKGLSLQQSRLDGLADPQAGWSYVEWILEFKNISRRDREARAQIALPPGGMVSRLTLWVNGEEREAAFAGTAQTRKAYRDVAVVQRRDPVLVTQAGQDRVLMQCFPVPRDGGTMKVRVGITAPWLLPSPETAALRLPAFLERNFSIPGDVSHSVWLESKRTLKSSGPLKEDLSKPGMSALRGELTDWQLLGQSGVLTSTRSDQAAPALVTLHAEDKTRKVRQVPRPLPAPDISRLVLVLDGAEDMTEYLPAIANALEKVPAGWELGVMLAQDGVRELFEPQEWTGETRRQLADRVRRLRGEGGQDNQACLLAAWDRAAESRSGAVLWIHGPQPVAFDRLEKLSQRLLWRPDQGSLLFDLATRPGPNRLAETPEMALLLTPVPRLGSLEEDLERLLTQLSGAVQPWAFARDLLTVRDPNEAGTVAETSRHVARLWARDEVERLHAAKQTAAAVELAARFQLVSSVSGAVVLENMQQFENAGLKPVDSDSVPTVPEPGTISLILVAALLFWAFARGRRRFRTGC